MNILDILKSIEQAIYEIALWVILIPKTIYHVLVHPGKIQEYVREELAKDDKLQFNDRMSPILFWLLLVIVPAYLLVRHFMTDIPGYLIKNPQNYFFYITCMLVSFLLTPAWMVNNAAKKQFDRVSFKEAFYVQCYLQTPISFLVVMLFGVLKYLHYNFDATSVDGYMYFVNKINGWKDIFFVLAVCLTFVMGFLEIRLLVKNGKSIGAAIGLIFLCLFIMGFVMCITGALGYLLFFET